MSPLIKEIIRIGADLDEPNPARSITPTEHISYHAPGRELKARIRGGAELVDAEDPDQVSDKQLASLAEQYPDEFAKIAQKRLPVELLGPTACDYLGIPGPDERQPSRFETMSTSKLQMLCDVYDVAVPPRADREQLVHNLEAYFEGQQDEEAEEELAVEDLDALTKAELAAIAADYDLDIPKGATKAALIDLIAEALEEEDEDPAEDQEDEED